MARRRRHEEHTNHEAWAIPYGDLITLLLAFFVVMYAISSVNEGKYRVLSDSLSTAFSGTPRAVEPIQTGDPSLGAASTIQISRVTQAGLDARARSMLDRVPLPSVSERTEADGEAAARLAAALAERQRRLDRIATEVEQAMQSLILSDQLEVRRQDGWVEVEIRTDLLFASGSAELGRAAVAALEQLADVLRTNPNPIRVEGHTDDRPIRTAAFPSNWELSAARAAGVVRVLAERGVDPARLAVLGFGEFRPVQPNTTAAGRLANRRVLLVILGDDAAPERVPGRDRAAPVATPAIGVPAVAAAGN
jgi:chemotaxis protein MotB